MASNPEDPPLQTHVTTVWRWQLRRRGFPLRRRKVQTLRLGGKQAPRRGMAAAVNMVRKMNVRWVKLQYICMVRRVKEYYRKLVKDMVEAGGSIEQFQQRVFIESTFAIPVGFASYPSRFGPHRHPHPHPHRQPPTLFM